MFDINRTIQLVSGALLDPQATWRDYLPLAGDWKRTAFLLTGPLIVVSALVAYALSLMTSGSSLFIMFRPTLLSTAFGIITGAIGAGVIAFIFSAVSGAFGGKNNFALGLAAITLAFVPGYVGQALAWLPWIGGLLAFGLGIFALVQLWKIIPLYLEVPDSKRVAHYITSLVGTIVVMIIIGAIVNPIVYGPNRGSPFAAMPASGNSEAPAEGMFSDAIRRAELMESAMKDAYTPPTDDRLTESQVQSYAAVVQRVSEHQKDAAARIQALADKTDEDGELSITELGSVMKGANEVGRLATSEMEVVKAAGGNWAEHQWVSQALFTASRQKSGNEVIAHNYSLYQKYADRLESNAQ